MFKRLSSIALAVALVLSGSVASQAADAPTAHLLTAYDGFSINTPAAGTLAHFAGTGLDQVTSVKVGTVPATISAKTATTLDIVVPASTTPNAVIANSVAVVFTYAGGTITPANLTYVGSIKQAASISFRNSVGTTAITGETRKIETMVVGSSFMTFDYLNYPVVYVSSTPTICTFAADVLTFLGAGACTFTSTLPETNGYVGAGPLSRTITVANGTPQTITPSAPSVADTYVNATGFDLHATVSTNRTLSYTSTTPTVCSATTAGHVVGLAVGTCSVTVSAATGSGFAPASYTFTFAITASPGVPGTPQTITVATPSVQDTFVNATGFSLVASSTSKLALAYASTTPAVCSVSAAGKVVGLTVGNCSITITQAGGSGFAAATPVVLAFAITATAGTPENSPFKPLALSPIGVPGKHLEASFAWTRAKGTLIPTVTYQFIGPVTALMGFTVGGKSYVCGVKFGTLKAVAAKLASATRTVVAPKAMCTAPIEAKGAAGEKAALAALKKAPVGTPVTFTLLEDRRDPVKFASKKGMVVLTVFATLG